MKSLLSTVKILIFFTMIIMGSLLAAGTISAKTLEEIRAAGVVRVGVLIDFPPYGIVDENNDPDGYDADVAKLFAERLGVKLELVPVTGPNRIPNLLTSRVDLIIGSLTITPERAKQVQFSHPYSVGSTVAYGRKDVALSSIDDFSTVSVAVPRASAQDIHLTKQAPKGTLIQRFDDDASATQALISGQVPVLAADITVVSQIRKILSPDEFEIKFPLFTNLFAMALRKGEEDILAWCNDFIAKALEDGSLDEISQKWLGDKLPVMEIPDYI